MKRVIWGVAAIVLLGVAGVFSVKEYKTWRRGRLTSAAQGYLKAGDYRNAALTAHQAVTGDPSNVGACGVLADLAELARSTNALFWRQRVVDLSPRDSSPRLLLARTALLLSRWDLASNALSAIDSASAAGQSADYHKLKGNLSWSTHDWAEAERHFVSALRAEATNEVTRMNLNLVRLVSGNAVQAGAARNELILQSTNHGIASTILRQLVEDAARRKDWPSAISFSQNLNEGTPSLADRLQYLTLLHDKQPADLAVAMARTQSLASTNAREAALVAQWMIDGQMRDQAWSWLRSLNAAMQAQRPVQQIMGELMVLRRDWPAMTRYLTPLDWQETDYWRELLLSRSAREEQNAIASRNHWLRCLKAAGSNLERLAHISKTAEGWGWRDEMDESLSALVRAFPDQRWAEEYLATSLHRAGKTVALQNLFARSLEHNPASPLAKSNFAILGLLLDPKDSKYHRLMAEAYSSDSTNAFVVSSYAVSLHFQRKTQEGLQALERLPRERLEQAAIAVWYGFLLAESGQPERAAPYLAKADKTILLPEEKKLLARVLKNS
ncbi:MAG: hypothetical protein HYR88_02410 [Verrucomicrobia bacterium]|nr:hypothetical protein [Verrucomicrobiota bacterium]MBI3870642.1 hypothetical protein [Verrucomicrobiota bacterium]